MNLTILQQFRQALYGAFIKEKNALFELCDALLSEPLAGSLPELACSPLYRREFCSIYKSLKRGRLDRRELQAVWCAFATEAHNCFAPTARMAIGVDACNIERPCSPTARDRGCLQAHNQGYTPFGGPTPITCGWQFSTVVLLPTAASSATYILDNRRIATATTPNEVAATQLQELAQLLPDQAVVVADRGYGSLTFLRLTQALKWTKLLRLKSNAVLYRRVSAVPAGAKRGRGAPPKDGAVFRLKDPSTYGPPDQSWQGVDEKGQPQLVQGWQALHFKAAEVRQVEVKLVRVERERATNKKRDPKVSWFMVVEPAGVAEPLELAEIVPLYKRRYSQEHGFRFDKQNLRWAKPRLRTPEQFELWTQVLSVVHNQAVLAMGLVEVVRRRWERVDKRASLGQLRRALGTIIGKLGSPACAPQVRGKSAGRPYGAKPKPAERYEVVIKTPKGHKRKRRAA